MKTFLLASSAAVLMSASLANAAMLIYSDDNDNKLVVNSWTDERNGAGVSTSTTEIRQYGAPVPATPPVSPGFLLHSDDNDNKRIETHDGPTPHACPPPVRQRQ